MQLTLLKGYPDYIGKRLAICGTGPGPASYAAGGDPVTLARYGNSIDILFPAVSVSGTYIVYPVPSFAGLKAKWKAKWVLAATGLEPAGGANLSGEMVQLGGFGGVT